MNKRLVKIKYSSADGAPLTKKLFGYRSWDVKSDNKNYVHKPIIGSLQSLLTKRVGGSKFIAPVENLPKIKIAIEKNHGAIREMEPVTMDEKDIERNARWAYRGFIDPLIEKMQYASGTQNKGLFVKVMKNGIQMTNYFEKFLASLDDYGSSFVKEESNRESEFIRRMEGLSSMASDDFEAAKIEAELFTADLENLRDQILK